MQVLAYVLSFQASFAARANLFSSQFVLFTSLQID